MFSLVLAVCIPLALHLRSTAREADRQREVVFDRVRQTRSVVHYLEARRAALATLRRDVQSYMTDVEARPIVAWTTALAELSRCRPAGLEAARLSGSGPRFRAQVTCASPQLVGLYAQSLRESPYVDWVSGDAQAGGAPATDRFQLVGRLVGE
jgi:hypothetical protein